jgi:hypothetical protein
MDSSPKPGILQFHEVSHVRVLRQILSPLRFSQHLVSVLRTRRRIEIVNRDGYFFGAKTVTHI